MATARKADTSILDTPLSAIGDAVRNAFVANAAASAAPAPAAPTTVRGALGLLPTIAHFVDDPVGASANYLVGLGNRMIAGGGPSNTDVTPVAVAQPTPAQAVSSAMTQGRATAVTPAAPTSQEMVGGALAQVLGSNPTVGVLRALGGLPGIASAATASAKQGQSARDAIFGQAAQLSGAMFQKELEDAAKTHGVGSPEYAKAFSKATDSYFQRNASLVANPAQLAQAQLLQPQEQ